MNGLYTSIFKQWTILLPLLSVYVAGIYLLNLIINNIRVKFSHFLIYLYFTSLVFVLAFHFFSPLGFSHLAANAASINNGIFVGVLQLKAMVGWFDTSFLQRLVYLTKDIFPNDCHYTLIGWTHPWGGLLIASILHSFSEFLNPRNAALIFGLIVTMFNNLLIPLIAILIKRISGEYWARKSSLLLILVPSVLFHISSLYEVIATVLIGILLWLSLYLIATKSTPKKVFSLMMLWSFIAILVAQWTYGLIIPLVVLFIFLIIKMEKEFLGWIILGVLFPVLLYFGIEFLLSSGHSFYLKRALTCVIKLGAFQVEARPYPLSQIANFTIISIMGGVLFLPSFVFSLMRFKQPCWEYKLLAILYLILLVFIRTPLEVERTWHWIFLFSWILIGQILKEVKNYYWTFVIMQAFVTLALALTIQDYY
jgi:hypothetical protein